MSKTPLLDRVVFPKDMRGFSLEELKQLAAELRAELIESVSQTGGHLGAGLGVVELTIALHHVFDTPKDLLIWDVGHQSYPHKILTGRRDRIRTLRQPGGLSGFCKREESEYDVFGAGHSSTSISAALGMAVARDMAGQDHEVIAVIGDGAMSAGMAFEALNNAGSLDKRLIVILNDNDMSIAPPVGAMSAYLARLISSRPYHKLRDIGKAVIDKFPESLAKFARKTEHFARDFALGGTLFDQMGFYYVGPVDGHNLDHLLPVLKNIKNQKDTGPVLLHVVTQKGYGYAPAEASDDKYHGVVTFDVATGAQKKSAAAAPSYTKVFAESLVKEAAKDDKIIAITAAMPSGTGLDLFAEKFPERFFDVGIAEQHAVTFAAGLATQGYKAFCAIYSTFLQRAYDQVVHDVAIQKLPVRFAIDRAGLVGADGATHAGSFDITYLAALPNFVVMAPSDEAELMHMVATAAAYDEGPIAFRYPRGEGVGVAIPPTGIPLEIGKGRILRSSSEAVAHHKMAILSLGTRLAECMKAGEPLNATVADARFAKPLDEMLIRDLLKNHALVMTVEEGSIGGFGAHVLSFAAREGLEVEKILPLYLPDYFMEQNKPHAQYDEAGLNAEQIIRAARDRLGNAPKLVKKMADLVVVGNQLTFNGKTYRCAVGKNGFSADKKEGDLCTPLGTFHLRECWVRADRLSAPKTPLPLHIIRENDGWCDDPKSAEYNKHIKLPFAASHEKLFRYDHVYDLIIPIGYNDDPIIPGKGSAIFMHIAKPDYAPTEGCVALAREDLLALLPRLDTKTSIEIRNT